MVSHPRTPNITFIGMRISNLNKQMFVTESMTHQATAMWATSIAELTYLSISKDASSDTTHPIINKGC
jgi:hypothetical protein